MPRINAVTLSDENSRANLALADTPELSSVVGATGTIRVYDDPTRSLSDKDSKTDSNHGRLQNISFVCICKLYVMLSNISIVLTSMSTLVLDLFHMTLCRDR